MLLFKRYSAVALTCSALLLVAAALSCTSERKEEPAALYAPEILPLPSAPPGFEAVPEPPDNPSSPEKAALGRQLFFDKRLSVDGSRSCYSCHLNQHGLTDGLPTAEGAAGKKLTRSSPTLWNVAYHKEFYWDGRSGSLEKQAMAAWTGANMGADKDKVAAAINAIPGYNVQFRKVFGSDATPENMMMAVTAFERTLLCGDTAFDRFQQGDASAVSEEAKRGWELFRGKAGCGTCHAGNLFTDLQYHNVGIGMEADEPDIGRKKVSNDEKDTGAFKTPTLRDISRSAPYFHNGSAATLEEAVDVMVGGGKPNKYLDTKNLKKVDLSAQEKSDLISFLQSLQCRGDLKEPELP